MAWKKKKIWRAGPGENFYRADRIDPSVIVEKFLKDVPVWIRKGQLNDLIELDQNDLEILYNIEKLPLNAEAKLKLSRKLNRPDMLQRLLRRYEIAQAIAKAKREGLYEANEHLTSKIKI